jgi:hypothetical protein
MRAANKGRPVNSAAAMPRLGRPPIKHQAATGLVMARRSSWSRSSVRDGVSGKEVERVEMNVSFRKRSSFHGAEK